MKVVIFAGGLGTRLMEETEARPKPMVEIGGKPILWHIMKMYSEYGFNDFILCLGYKQAMIKEFFINYYSHNSDLTIDLKNNTSTIHNSNTENFNVTLVDTGLMTNTAGRLKRVQKFLGNETFMLTYGDGVSDVNIQKLVEFHKEKKKIATLTAIQMPGRYGNIEMNEDGIIQRFVEKPEGDGVWINGGFMVLEPTIFNYFSDDADEVQFEKGPLLKLANENQIASFKHNGFWKCMDALRDKMELEELWNTNQAKWKRWIS
jgi:glucose-1-phosphate cytidylyltransferase